MNTQSMRYFSVVARLENASRAAELLHTTQSSVSKNISNLEKELGMPLFERNGKKITLNEAGKSFLKYCDKILQETENAYKELRNLREGGDNMIRISTAGTEKRLLECMAEFRKIYSNTEYIIRSFQPGGELPDINQVDVMIYPDEDRFRKYDGYDFYQEKYYLAVNKDSPLTSHASLPTRMLNGRSFVILRYTDEPEYPFFVCSAQNIQMASVHYVDSRELHLQMVAQGLGAGFVPDGQEELYRRENTIRLVHLSDSRFSRRMKVCFKRDKHLSSLAAEFKKYMIRYFQLAGS